MLSVRAIFWLCIICRTLCFVFMYLNCMCVCVCAISTRLVVYCLFIALDKHYLLTDSAITMFTLVTSQTNEISKTRVSLLYDHFSLQFLLLFKVHFYSYAKVLVEEKQILVWLSLCRSYVCLSTFDLLLVCCWIKMNFLHPCRV
jgi:hypothetical protein